MNRLKFHSFLFLIGDDRTLSRCDYLPDVHHDLSAACSAQKEGPGVDNHGQQGLFPFGIVANPDAEIQLQSINGVYVNNHQLTPLEEHQLKEGDLVRVGVAAGPDQPSEFVWSYHKCLKVAKKRRKPQEETAKRANDCDDEQKTKKSKPDVSDCCIMIIIVSQG